jgi:hypothetical protein
MLPALKNVVADKKRPIPLRSMALFGTTAQGMRSVCASGRAQGDVPLRGLKM